MASNWWSVARSLSLFQYFWENEEKQGDNDPTSLHGMISTAWYLISIHGWTFTFGGKKEQTVQLYFLASETWDWDKNNQWFTLQKSWGFTPRLMLDFFPLWDAVEGGFECWNITEKTENNFLSFLPPDKLRKVFENCNLQNNLVKSSFIKPDWTNQRWDLFSHQLCASAQSSLENLLLQSKRSSCLSLKP